MLLHLHYITVTITTSSRLATFFLISQGKNNYADYNHGFHKMHYSNPYEEGLVLNGMKRHIHLIESCNKNLEDIPWECSYVKMTSDFQLNGFLQYPVISTLLFDRNEFYCLFPLRYSTYQCHF